jgi:hypothetical protein
MALASLVEGLNTSLPLGPGDERLETPAWVVVLRSGGDHPEQTVVRPLDFREDVPTTVQSIRNTLRRYGRRCATWELGPSAMPANLGQQLLAAGLKPYQDPVVAGMVLRKAPRETGALVPTRRAEKIADYVEAFQIMNAVFAERKETAAQRMDRARQIFELDQAGRGALFLGIFNGRVVAAARSQYLTDAVALIGGSTLPHARGQGAYRSLVVARSIDAVRRGTPVLVVHAGRMSRPILTQLGFETVIEITVLLDEWEDAPRLRSRS